MSVQPNEIVLSFRSHRVRDKSGINKDPAAKAVYSFTRASYGYYRIDKSLASQYLKPGVVILRAPYDDILDCWG